MASTYVFLGLLVAMIAALALEEKIHAKKSMITGFFALVCLLAAAVFELLPDGHALQLPHAFEKWSHLPVYIPAIEWEVIAIILGSSLFIDVVSRSGIFSWAAIRLTKISGGDPLKLLVSYCVLTVVFSAVLNNVTAMIIIGSLTAVSLDKLERKDLMLGFLLTEGLMTNIGGLLTLISSVPNIILGSKAGIAFIDFVIVAAPYVVLSTALTIALAVKIFGIRSLKTDDERQAAASLVASFDENDGIASRPFFNIAWALLGAFILTIATTSVIPYVKELGMGFVAMGFAIIALLRYKHEVDKSYAAIDWDLLAFFAYLFVVIDTMEHAGVLALIGDGIGWLLGAGEVSGGALLLWATALASSMTDNVPLAAVMGNILGGGETMAPEFLWWSTIFGTNLGGNFTPIGSASTVVAVAIIHKNRIPLSFGGFVVKAAPFALAQLILATAYVLLFLR
jgi:Na+/H+ antiporter NhaD/arsenite permease-like protein